MNRRTDLTFTREPPPALAPILRAVLFVIAVACVWRLL